MATKIKSKYCSCAVCKRDILNLHIRCAECSIDLCGECFARGSTSADVPAHLPTHPYQVVDHLPSIALFDNDWNAKEELLLLDGIETYGLGNWRNIANLVGTKTEQQCYRHYMDVYLESSTAPLPSASASHTTLSRSASAITDANDGAGGQQPSISAGRTGASTTASQGTPGYNHSHVPKTDVAGYMPLRGDFDIEYDNDAEAILADMDFVEGEHTTETELKLKILEIYNAKLDERERRKTFVIERGLLEYKRMLAVERRRPKEERDVYDCFRSFARFMTPQEHEDLVRGVILEQRLRKRIAQLQEYRKAGIRSLAEAQEYEAAKRKREQTAPKRQSSLTETTDGPRLSKLAAARRVAQQDISMKSDETNATNATNATNDDVTSGRKRRRDNLEAMPLPSLAAASEEPPLCLEGIPGADRLTHEERKLCEYLRLLPQQYQQIKATVINISLVRGRVRREEAAGSLVHIDAAKVDGVYDFCVYAGWATEPTAE